MKKKIFALLFVVICFFGISVVSVSAAESRWLWPSDTRSMSCAWWDTYYHGNAHRGIDIRASYSNVYASKSGTAYQLGYNSARGYYMVIDHGDGYYSEYQHLDRYSVPDGTYVNQGDVIAISGNTGQSTGPHLHFEIMNLGSTGLAKSYNSYYNSTSKFVNVDPQASTYANFCTNDGVYHEYYSNTNGIDYIYEINTNPPSNPQLSIDKTKFDIGETVHFSCSAKYATGYTIGIDLNGKRVFTNDIGAEFEKTFDVAGTYTAYISAWNSYGLVDSPSVSFTVSPKALYRINAKGSIYKNGHLYSLFDTQYDWETAKHQTEIKGGYLATIANAEENNTISELISKGSSGEYWIGYTDKESEGNWKWVTGEESSYTNWASGEPNNQDGNEDYATIGKSSGQWNDEGNSSNNVGGLIYETYTFTPAKTVYYNNVRYDLYQYPVSWHDAKQLCEDLGGHLAVVTSSDENQAIAGLIEGSSWNDYWIGCSDEENEGEWKWITGEKFEYSNWNDGEPSNSSSNEHFGSYQTSSKKWNDIKEDHLAVGFICETENETELGYIPVDTIIHNDSVLSIYDRPLSWTDAQAFCQSACGNLVTINSEQKQVAVYELIKKGAFTGYYIGYTDKDTEGTWKWISGQRSSYTNWSDGEPNNSGDEDYSEIVRSHGKWNDIGGGVAAGTKRGFIVEINKLPYDEDMEFKGNTYYRFDSSMPWTEAKAYCELLGGHLATISSEEENNAINSLTAYGEKSSYWIGYTDKDSEGEFKWVDGSSYDYSNWRTTTNEPNNSFSCENYTSISKSGIWNDLRNSEFSSCGFICEIEGEQASPSPAPTATPVPTPTPTSTPTTPPTEDGVAVKVSSATAAAGKTVNVMVDLSDNKGFANLGLQVGYDSSVLTLTSVSNNSAVGATYTGAQNLTANPYNMGWDSTSNVSYNGTLATLTFKVSDDAADGTYPITVSYYTGLGGNYMDGEDVNYDENFYPLNLNYVQGAITVSSHIAGDINGDGKVNNQDGTFLLRHLAGWNVNVDESALDVNGDSKINNQDGTVLLRYLAGWSVTIH